MTKAPHESPEAPHNDLELAVSAALVELLYEQGPLMVAGNLVTCAAMVAILYDHVALPVLFSWATVLVVWAGLRLWLMRRYSQARPEAADARRWGWGTALFSTGFGLLWGTSALLFIDTGLDHGEHLFLTIFPVLIMGLNAIGTVSLAPFPPASVGFALSSNLLLMMALYATDNSAAPPLIVMVIIALTSNLKNIRSLFKALDESLRLRFDNQQLRQMFEHKSLRLETTLGNIDQGLALLDRHGRLTMWNQRLLALMGGPAKVAELTPFKQLSLELRRADLSNDSVTGMSASPDDCLWQRSDGRYLEICKTDIGNGESVVTCSDVTTLKRREQALRQVGYQAEQATIAKTRFLAAASHDLRQPVQALALVRQLLEERARGGELQPLVEQLGQGIDTLDGLLGNLLHISKLEAGLETPDRSEFAITELFDELANEFALVAREHNDRLRFRSRQHYVVSDRYMLARILSNLIANAIKYTRNGRVLVTARRYRDQLRICVYDNGPGIPDVYQTRIFEEFQQLHNPERDRSQGLGLGLAIVKRTAAVLDHRIDVASQVDRGSCFSVWIPLATHPAKANTPPMPTAATAADIGGSVLVGRRIWVIDDDPIVSRALVALLEHWGCQVESADRLETALALAATQPAPEAMLFDYRLPGGITGLEVARQLFDRFGHTIPCILVTGDTDPERLREASTGGFPLLHKPASPQLLHATLQALLEGRPPT